MGEQSDMDPVHRVERGESEKSSRLRTRQRKPSEHSYAMTLERTRESEPVSGQSSGAIIEFRAIFAIPSGKITALTRIGRCP